MTATATSKPYLRRFGLLGLLTIIIIYSLILVGGIVRATGAGMGCPDWPTCFGQWIPPTAESQLPADYQTIYADRGYRDTTFNVRKTWTEYLNRLLGVFTGFMIFATLIASIPFRKTDPPVFQLALAGFLLVGFQGWLGSRVVASNLSPGLITIHMLVAQVIVAILIAGIARSQRDLLAAEPLHRLPVWFGQLLMLVMGISLLQMVVGTQVREAVDMIAQQSEYANRHLWIENLPVIFEFHQYSAIPLLLLNALLLFFLFRDVSQNSITGKACVTLVVVLTGTTVMGMSMQRLNLPIFAQPLHLWLSSLIFGVQFFLYIVWRYSRGEGAVQSPSNSHSV